MRIRMVLAAVFVLVTVVVSSAQQVFSSTEPGVTLPVVTERARAWYTRAAWDQRIEGRVTAQCDVLADGTVGAVMITGSLDREYGLDDEAVKAMRAWKFRPGTKDGVAVAVRVPITINFTLQRPQ